MTLKGEEYIIPPLWLPLVWGGLAPVINREGNMTVLWCSGLLPTSPRLRAHTGERLQCANMYGHWCSSFVTEAGPNLTQPLPPQYRCSRPRGRDVMYRGATTHILTTWQMTPSAFATTAPTGAPGAHPPLSPPPNSPPQTVRS